MPGDLSYAHEKFTAGRSILAEIDAPLRDRLVAALDDQAFRCLPLKPGLGDSIDDELANEMEAFYKAMTSAEARGHGRVRATVDGMDDDEVRQRTSEFLGLVTDLDRAYYGAGGP